MIDDTVDIQRRNLLRGRIRTASTAIRPPWSKLDRFASLCTRCGKCGETCPEGIVVMADGGFPEVDFSRGECTFCGTCAETCPAPVFSGIAGRPWDAVATVAASCLSAQGITCRSCQDACDHSAIRFTLAAGGVANAHVDARSCTGCGACVSTCPVGAIAIQVPADRIQKGNGHAAQSQA